MNPRNLILFVFISAPMVGIALDVYWHFHPLPARHFVNVLPEQYEVLDESHDVSVREGRVSWLIRTKVPPDFRPDGYADMAPGPDGGSRYREIQSALMKRFPEESSLTGKIRILSQEPEGDRFIGVLNGNKLVLYRRWSW